MLSHRISIHQPWKQVAIIGAGAAGSSSAYFLRRFAEEAGIPVDITVLEQNNYIGGRSTTVCAFENQNATYDHGIASHDCIPLELGASIFVRVNQILVDAVKSFNLSASVKASGTNDDDDGREEEEEESIGIWDGERFVFTQRMTNGRLQYWWNTVKILWRYGISPYRTQKMMQSTVARFLMLYDGPYFPWKRGLDVAARAVGLLNTTSSTGLAVLQAGCISDRFAKDIVQASTRVNYAQNIDAIHGLEAMVCMATEGAMAVEGGNWQIFAAMLNASGADVYLNSKVDEIEIGDPNERISLSSKDLNKQDYGLDALILAAPYHQAGIKFTPSPLHIPENVPYVDLHVTLFGSPHKLSPKAFGLAEPEQVPDVILTTLPEESKTSHGRAGPAGFFSISMLRSAHNPYTRRKEYIYKIFSPNPITPAFMQRILGLHGPSHIKDNHTAESEIDPKDVSWIYRKLWQSYPYLPPRRTFEPSVLDTNLWYTSGIESFISTMETSALSGKNVARLIVDGWLEDAH